MRWPTAAKASSSCKDSGGVSMAMKTRFVSYPLNCGPGNFGSNAQLLGLSKTWYYVMAELADRAVTETYVAGSNVVDRACRLWETHSRIIQAVARDCHQAVNLGELYGSI